MREEKGARLISELCDEADSWKGRRFKWSAQPVKKVVHRQLEASVFSAHTGARSRTGALQVFAVLLFFLSLSLSWSNLWIDLTPSFFHSWL